MPEVSLIEKTALITGAARRIGRETALALANAGANIIVHYRSSEEPARQLAGELKKRGVKAWTIQADFAESDSDAGLIDQALKTAGSLDILVNNASEFPSNNLDDITFDDLMSSIRVNAWTPFALCRSFAATVGKGKIVNMLDSRIAGFDWTHVGYIISKHVLAAFTRMAALEYAPDIQVNAVSPGLILPPPGKDETYIDRLKDTVPLKKHGDPRDVADAVVYLVKSDFLTGEVICVDGGRHLREYVTDSRGAR